MLASYSRPASFGWTVVIVAASTAFRFMLDQGANGVPFVTYYPAIVVAGLFLGWRWGLLAAILCAAAARLLFMQDQPPLGQSVGGLLIVGLFVLSCAALLAITEALRRTIAQLSAASARETLLNQELRHRLKNVLALTGSLASLSRRHSDPANAHDAFIERLTALGRAVDLLGTEGPASCALPDLAEEALRPFVSAYDIRLNGPRCVLDRDCCVPAVLALHELSTNAIKHGALSEAGGWVEFTWTAQGESIAAHWRERGGPPVVTPQRKGIGSRILSMRSRDASFELDFAAEGVICAMTLRAGQQADPVQLPA